MNEEAHHAITIRMPKTRWGLIAVAAIALAVLLVVQTVPTISGSGSAGVVADEFDGTSLAPAWTFVDPLVDGSVVVGGGAVSISTPGGINHDIWTSGVNAPRIMQTVSDGDLQVEAKFDSGVNQKFQLQGILARDTGTNYLRFGNYYNGSTAKAFVAAINPVTGSVQILLNQSITASSTSYLRLTRNDDLWTFERSIDGITWQVLKSFTRTFTLAEIGLYAGNVGSPAHTAIVDYFRDTMVPVTQPAAVDDSASVDEDVTLNVAAPGVLANDSDPELDPLTAVLETGVLNGALTLNADGSFSYTPTFNFNGVDSFTYRATDGVSISTPATVTITVNPVNDPPVATAQSVTTEQDTATAITLTGTDVDGDPLTFTVVTLPANGILSGTAPNLTYTPAATFFGSDSFTFTVSDALLTSAAATVSITVFEVNEAPVAVDDPNYSTDEDVTLNVIAPGVLANDTDADLDPLTAELVTGATNGAVTLNADGSFSYMPNANFNGVDSFTYRAWDAVESSASATVTITVNAVNDVPVATAQSVSTDMGVATPVILAATDVESDPLTYLVTTGPTQGSLTGTPPNLTYTPFAGYTGPDSFEFTASDAVSTSAPATVTISVSVPGLLFSDEFDGASLAPEWTFVNPLADGSLIVGGGTASITSPAGVNHDIWSSGVNAPRIMQQVPDGDFVLEVKFNSALTQKFQLQGVLIQQDANNFLRIGNYFNGTSVKSIVAVVHPVSGSAQILNSQTIPAPGISYLRLSRSGDLWTFERSTDGVAWLTITTFTRSFVMSEIGVYAGNVGVPSHTTVVDYFRDVTPPAPDALDDAYATDEDVTLVVAAPGVLANDVDAEGDPLTAVLEAGPTNGALTLNSDGSFTYTPNPNFNGIDIFTYRATDGIGPSNVATVTLTVNAINDVPTVQDLSLVLEQDTFAAVTLLGADADGDPLTYAVTVPPANGTLTGTAPNLTYTPTAGYFGPDSFVYTASDAISTSLDGTVSITVFALNEAPVAQNDTYSVDEDVALNVAAPGVLTNDSDLDADPMTAELVSSTSNGSLTLNADGSFSYSPNSQFNGVDSFTYIAKDAWESSSAATVTITVNAVNDVPVATPQSVSVVADVATAITLAATDVEGDPLSFTVTTAPTNGVLSGTAPNLTYTPATGYIGPDSFLFTASDAVSTSAPATVQITVSDPNDPIINFWLGENQKVNNLGRPQVWADVLGNVADPDGVASLSYTLNGGPSQTLSIGPDGRRLHKTGDFIIQIPFTSLPIGYNQIVVTAVDTLGHTVQKMVTLDYPGRNFWPETFTTDWSSTQNVQDFVQVVDGDWDVGPNGLTNIGKSGYDRTVAIGDISWTNYTATIPVTVNDWNRNGNWCCGLGVIVRWQGHTNDPVVCVQPSCGWEPSGNHVWYNWKADGGYASNFEGAVNTLKDTSGLVLQFGVTYVIKVEAETIGTDNWYRMKVWAQSDPEPVDWMVEVIRNADGLSNGSLLLIAHHLDVTFGDVQISTIGTNPNSPPVAVAESYTLIEDSSLNVAAPGILGNDTDAESDPLTAVRVTEPANGALTINADGSFSYIPNANFSGTDSFSYRAADATGSSNVEVVTLNVTAVNDVPTVEDQSLVFEQDTVMPITLVATDPDSGALTYAITVPPTNGTLTGTAPNLTYTPNAGYFGLDSFKFTASDAVSTSLDGTVSLDIFKLNEAPVAVADSYVVDEDVVLNVAAPGVLANDTDAELDPLTAQLMTGASNGVVILNADGSFSYTPNAEYSGADSFTYIASDARKSSPAVTVTITVNAVNDPPVATAQSLATDADVALPVTLSGTDAEGDPLTFLVTTLPLNGTLSGTAPNLTYTPNAGYIGPDSFEFTASDAFLTSAPAVIDIIVRDPGRILSDEFDGTTLSPAWTFIDPLADSSVAVAGGVLSITVAGVINHDIWSSGIKAPRIMQQVSDSDFSVEAKFNSALTQKFQLQGFLVKQDDNTYLRVGNYYNGTSVKSIVAVINPISGSAQLINSQTVTASSTSYLRLTRAGDLWTFERSIDGVNWLVLTTFTRTFTMTEIGLYAGNVGGPAHTGIVDYFRDVSTP